MVRHWFDPLSIGLMLVLLLLAGYCLEATAWLPELNRVTALILLGGFFGMLFGYSNFSVKTSIWMVMLLSVEMISWQLIFQIPGNQVWLEKGVIFLDRIIQSINQILDNKPLQDGILFLIAMSLMFWTLGFGSGFTLTRFGKPWIFIFFIGMSIIVIQLFLPSEKRSYFLMASFCFFLLLFIVRLQYLSAHFNWLAINSTEDQNTFSTILTIVLIASFSFILVAWSSPFLIRLATPGSRENQEFREKFTDVWQPGTNFFAPLKQTTDIGYSGVGNSLSLTTTRSKRMELVFSVKTDMQSKGKIPNYWKSRSFEYYQDGIWKNVDSYEEIITSDTRILTDSLDSSGTVQFEFFPHLNSYQIYHSNDPASIDRDVILLKVKGFTRDEIISILSVQPLRKGASYILKSTPISYSLTDLISANDDYPKDIREIYLQLPSTDLSRIRALAVEITKGKSSQFEKVEAITSFLRSNFSYSDSLSGSPMEKGDLVEWFLFNGKQGFCIYFASAEVILLRSIGIPARLAVGYSQGLRREDGSIYEVRDMDNHAWPEIFFNEIGWIIFEPTPSQPFIDYSVVLEKPDDLDLDAGEGYSSYRPFAGDLSRPDRREEDADLVVGSELAGAKLKRLGSLLGSISLFVLIFYITLLWAFREKIFRTQSLPFRIGRSLEKIGVTTPKYLLLWDGFIQKTKTEKSFLQINLLLSFMGEVHHQADTARQKVSRLIKSVPTCREDAVKLLNQYEMEKYAGRNADVNIVRAAIRGIWLSFFKDRIQKVRGSLNEIFSRNP